FCTPVGHSFASTRVFIPEQAECAEMNSRPFTVRILYSGGDLVPSLWLVGLNDTRRLCLHAEINAIIRNVGNRIIFLGEQLRQRLAGIFIVKWNIVAEIGLDRFKHRSPVGPLWWTIVANDVGSMGGRECTSHRQRDNN